MKNLTLVFMAVTSLNAASAFAATTGSLFLSGTNPQILSLVVTPNVSNNTSLDLVNGAHGVNVASVAETTNDRFGYKINAKSANSGKLVNGSANVPYTIAYNGALPVTLSTSDQQVKNVSSLSQLTTNVSAVSVTTTGSANLLAGTYSDTVTFTIVAN